MPMHSAPTNSIIFAQKARERAAQVLALKEEHPGLMRGETPQPTVTNRLKRHAMPIMMFMMMLVMLPMMAHMVNRNNTAAAVNANNNNLRANGGETASFDESMEDESNSYDDNEDEETGTSTSTYPPTENDQVEYELEGNEDQALVPGSPEFCVDDPDYRYNGEEDHPCEWLKTRHTANRCDHVPTLEHCRATCHPKCNGGLYEIFDEILEEAEEEDYGFFEEEEEEEDMDVEDESEEEESNDEEEAFEEEEEEDDDETDMDSDEEEEYEGVSCIDDVNFRYQGDESKDCNWVFAKFTNYRCGFPEVLAACPATCSPECGTFPPTSDGTSTSTSTSTSIVSMDEDEMLSI